MSDSGYNYANTGSGYDAIWQESVLNILQVDHTKLDIRIYIRGDHVGFVNTYISRVINGRREYIMQVDENRFVKVYMSLDDMYCYICGKIKPTWGNPRSTGIWCKDCSDEYDAAVTDRYAGK